MKIKVFKDLGSRYPYKRYGIYINLYTVFIQCFNNYMIVYIQYLDLSTIKYMVRHKVLKDKIG